MRERSKATYVALLRVLNRGVARFTSTVAYTVTVSVKPSPEKLISCDEGSRASTVPTVRSTIAPPVSFTINRFLLMYVSMASSVFWIKNSLPESVMLPLPDEIDTPE